MCEAFVIFRAERHHLDGEVAEVGAAHTQGFLQIVCAGKEWILASDNKQILKRAEFLYGYALLLDFLGCKNHAVDFIVAVKAAVYA